MWKDSISKNNIEEAFDNLKEDAGINDKLQKNVVEEKKGGVNDKLQTAR